MNSSYLFLAEERYISEKNGEKFSNLLTQLNPIIFAWNLFGKD